MSSVVDMNFDDLYRVALARVTGTDSPFAPEGGARPSDVAIARELGISYRTWLRWKKAGKVPAHSADQVAVRGLGMHPAVIWGHDFYAGVS